MLKYLIIEDEIPNAQRLQRMLQTIAPCEIVDTLQTVADSVQYLRHCDPPDIIFMDIQLLDGMSFEILEQVNVTSPIIFLTAYNQFALKAFEVNAIDYLLKPILLDKLAASIEKAKKYLPQPDTSVNNILREIHKQDKLILRQRFLVAYRDRLIPIAVNNIAYFYSENKVTHIVTFENKDYLLDNLSLEKIEIQISPKTFLRVTRQCICHIDAVANIYQLFNGQIGIELKPAFKEPISLSREKSKQLKNWIENS